MLPGGRGVLFTISANTLEEEQLAVLDLKSGEQKTLLRGGVAAHYLNTGHLVYATVSSRGPGPVSGTLWAVAFDLDRLALRGEPVHVSETETEAVALLTMFIRVLLQVRPEMISQRVTRLDPLLEHIF